MGQIFHHVGMEVGFDALGAAGKLMGLAPYGQPRLFDSQWVGNTSDLIERGLTPTPEGWVDHVAAKADELQYDRDAPSLKHIPFNRYQIDLAASTQYLFEKQWQALVKAACAMMAGNGLSYDNLCLSGGASLNCPSNSAIVRNTNIRNLFIEPSCDDSGLSIGAALWLHYDLMENPYNESARFTQKDVYAGRSYTDAEVLNALQAVAEQVEYEKRDNQCERAAEDLAGRSIIGWFQGGSEQGPRALGHRSLLALPVDKQMHQRVNALKNREQWRPLAPAVLEEKYRTTFHDLPNCSPFMLQTGISAKSQQYPAITHIDGSARVQTVHPEMGEFYNLLNCLYRISGHPLVLNTSMNGPGEPIVETPDNALQFLLNSDLEVLYLQGYRVTKVEPKPSQGS